jgi:heptosyltransferase-3
VSPAVRRTARDASPARVAVVVTRQIGDVLLTTPLIAAIAGRWPEARIDVVGAAGTLGMLDGNPHVAARIELPARLRLRDVWRFVRAHGRAYDLTFIAEASDRAHLVGLALGGARVGLVPAEPSHAWWKRRLLAHAVEVAGDRGDRHVVDEKLALLEPWPDARVPAPAVVPPGLASLPADLEAALDARPVVVHAPAMWAYKQWPADRFAALVASLVGNGRQVVLTGGSTPRDRAIVDRVVAALPPAASGAGTHTRPRLLDVAGRLDFRQLATLLRRAALYIGADGSVTHLAAACGTPVVAVFGPTDPRRWAPLGPDGGAARFARVDPVAQRRGRVVVLQGPHAGRCVPCGRAGCDDHRDSRSACLEAIDVGRVLAETQKVLSPSPGQPDSSRSAISLT